jgi:hypothetical protein
VKDTSRDVDNRLKSALSELGVPKSKVMLQQGGSMKVSKKSGITGALPATLTRGFMDRHDSLIQENIAHLVDRGLQVHCKKYGCGHSKVHNVVAIPNVQGGQHLQEVKDACPSCRTS